jgi:acetylornithine deacetylase/succinyl-diaminopimelate desuccinylase-like protein
MLGSKMLVTGFGLPDDALHSPNERFSLEQYHRATETVARLFHELAVLD